MSEKHLTEPPWKLLVAKHGIKDLGLLKALTAYAKVDATKEPSKELEALKEISELALKLKKPCAAKEDVADYLDEMVKEVKKVTPVLEAKIKSASAALDKVTDKPAAKDDAEADLEAEEEAAEFKKDLKNQMVGALAQVKLRAPGDPAQEKEPKPQLKFMAYLAGKSSAVIVGRKVGSATKKLLPDIAGVTSGGKFVTGECRFEKNAHTFVLDLVPSGLAKKLATALVAETGQKYKVRVRSTDGSMVLDSDTDLDPDAPLAPAAPAPPPPTKAAPDASAEEMTKFTARFKALQPDLLKAIATKTPKGDEVKQRAAEAGGLATKKDFVKANQVLDVVETLMKLALAAPGQAPRLSTYMNATRDWKAAKKTAGDGVFALKNAIFKECDQELEKAVKAKIDELNGIITVMDDGIIAKIEDAGREADPERQVERNQELAKYANNVLAALRNHPLARVADSNPFGTFTIRVPVETALTKIITDFGG